MPKIIYSCFPGNLFITDLLTSLTEDSIYGGVLFFFFLSTPQSLRDLSSPNRK